jgi:hypothetical protein
MFSLTTADGVIHRLMSGVCRGHRPISALYSVLFSITPTWRQTLAGPSKSTNSIFTSSIRPYLTTSCGVSMRAAVGITLRSEPHPRFLF